MPNWCMNQVTFTHEKSKEITRLKKAFLESRTCDEFVPCAPELKEAISPNRDDKSAEELLEKYGYTDWYMHNVNEWGTKWDFGGGKDNILKSKRGMVMLSFDTAWSPPIAFYEKMEELGFTVEAYYYEMGMGFCGKFSNGFDDYYDLSNLTAEEVEAALPEDVDATFCISEYMYDREAEEEDDNEGECDDE